MWHLPFLFWISETLSPFKIFQTAPPISPFFLLNERFFFKQEAQAPTPPPQARFGRPQLIFPIHGPN